MGGPHSPRPVFIAALCAMRMTVDDVWVMDSNLARWKPVRLAGHHRPAATSGRICRGQVGLEPPQGEQGAAR